MRKSARTQIPPFFDNDPYMSKCHIVGNYILQLMLPVMAVSTLPDYEICKC